MCFLQETISPSISKSIELQLVEEAVINPSALSVFNHPANKVNSGSDISREKGLTFLANCMKSQPLFYWKNKMVRFKQKSAYGHAYAIQKHVFG